MESKSYEELSSLILKKDSIKQNEHFRKVFIFTSIDLVNSTTFKNEHSDWVKVFTEFYGIVKSEFTKENKVVWKSIGDELLFYEEIVEMLDLLKYPSSIFRLMEKCERILYEKIPKTRKKLFLKGAMWVSSVKEEEDRLEENKDIKNVILNFGDNLPDFIGPDIDEGFRLSKYTSQNKLVIDAKLSNLMYRYKDDIYRHCDYVVEDRLRIVGYRKLKGIWNDRLYPIIWYHKNWDNPESMYLYDEHESTDIVNEIKERLYKVETIKKIEKIFDETNRKNEVELLEKIIKEANKNKKLSLVIEKNLVELHLAAVCIDENTDKILIIERVERDILNKTWEFGCAKAKRNLTVEESILKEYKEDFGIDISIIKDKKRDMDPQPIPIAIYNINDNPPMHKGILFVATFNEKENPIRINSNKHGTHKLFKLEEIIEFSDQNTTVPDFKDTVEKAYKLYNDNKVKED